MDTIRQQIAGEITLAKNPGAAMKKWREIFGVTQTELAEHLKITPSTVSDYESNRRKSPGINVIKRFINALIEIDMKRGGKILKRMEEKKTEVFETHEFPAPVSAKEICEKINGRIITNKRKINEMKVNGYTIVDSLRAILELPVDEFPKIYGPTTNRVLIFTKVGIGRSPMVAIRVTKFKPSLVVYHGLEKMDDPIAKKISEVEKIPIVLTTMDLDKIKDVLSSYE
ncbi:MAG: helix-turn-helix domain-containing protein [Candidatus Diapherotrites archaeon]|nr:helix-turn-helix domain-containing protein [Candidatus Diapherotrites archaeon]